jgi:putative transposase
MQAMTNPRPQGELSIERMCVLARVSRAGYYRHWRASKPRQETTMVRDLIQKIALAGGRRLGYRPITWALRRQDMKVNHKRVLRLMGQDNLLCLKKKPFVPVTTNSRHGWEIVANLARGLILSGIDQLWVADITYIHLQEEFAFVAVLLDAFSRRVIGWAVADHLRASLTIKALQMALAARRPRPHSLIHHSDRGVQYACNEYTAILKAHGIRASMSRVGNPYDNAKAERLMRTLKEEEVDLREYRDLAEVRPRIAEYFERYYNTARLHSALGYRPPAEFELLHRAKIAAQEGGSHATL